MEAAPATPSCTLAGLFSCAGLGPTLIFPTFPSITLGLPFPFEAECAGLPSLGQAFTHLRSCLVPPALPSLLALLSMALRWMMVPVLAALHTVSAAIAFAVVLCPPLEMVILFLGRAQGNCMMLQGHLLGKAFFAGLKESGWEGCPPLTMDASACTSVEET